MKNTNIEEYEKSKAFSKNLFPDSSNVKFLIDAETQNRELERIRTGLRYENFFSVVNMLDFEIKHLAGFEVLGYNSNQVTLKDYFGMIKNDGIVQLMSLLGRETFNLTEMRAVGFLRPKFITNLPMLHADGRIMLVKRTLSTWQISSDAKVVEYLSEFTLIGEYHGEPMNPRIEEVPQDLKEKFDQVVNKIFAIQPHFKNPFSPKEMILLRYYSENKNTSAQKAAQDNGIEVSTMHYYNKQMLSKAKNFFGKEFDFTTAKEVATFLNKNGFFN
jgi:hypothetical protein